MNIHVDRSKSLGELLGPNNVERYFEVAWQDAAARALSAFETERLTVERLAERRYTSPSKLLRKVERRIGEIHAGGGVPLDAHMGASLLAGAPGVLGELVQGAQGASGAPNAESAVLRFDGTRFVHPVEAGYGVVLGAGLDRGRWGYAMSPTPPRQVDFDHFAASGGYPFDLWTVVLQPE